MKNLLYGCLALVLFASCKKEVDELPEATQTGAHTFGAKVNGEIWIPEEFGPFSGSDILEAIYTAPNNLLINARNFSKSPKETEFEIFLTGVTGPGTFQLNTNVVRPTTAANYAYYLTREITPTNEWLTSSTYTGSVTITKFDTANNIVSGTFQFNALNLTGPPQPLSVSEGRFDIRTQ